MTNIAIVVIIAIILITIIITNPNYQKKNPTPFSILSKNSYVNERHNTTLKLKKKKKCGKCCIYHEPGMDN